MAIRITGVPVFRLEKGLILCSRCLQKCPCQPERQAKSKYMSNERVTCVVLIGCGLSLEGVAGVDQEGPPGEGGAKAGFEETTELLK